MDYRTALEQGFKNAPFVAHAGIELEALGPCRCKAGLLTGKSCGSCRLGRRARCHVDCLGQSLGHPAVARPILYLRSRTADLPALLKLHRISVGQRV